MIRKEQQRFSLRKYKVGVASVFLGTTLSFMMANGAAAFASELPAQPVTEEKTELVNTGDSSGESSNKNVETTEVVAEAKEEVTEPQPTETTNVAESQAAPEVKEGIKPETTEVKSEAATSEKPATETIKAFETKKEVKPAVSEGYMPKVRGRRAATDHNNESVSVETYLKNGETTTPDMTDPNGATVRSQTVPAGYSRKEGDYYTYSIVDLTEFNKRYNTNYYSRSYKKFIDSTDTTVELIDKNTGAVVETKTISATSGVQKFTTTATASNGELTYQVDFDKGTPTSKAETAQPFLQYGFEVGAAIQALVAPGHNLTTEEQKLFDAVYAARTSTDIINVVEPAYNGRQITDTNSKIPSFVEKTTYYRVVDKNNATFNANKTDKTVQDYVPNGNEVDLAKYTTKAMEGQNFTASGERQFDGYKLYQTADPDTTTGYVSRPYKVGTKFIDAERAGIKRIKEIVGEDGSVVVRVYLLDPKQQSKRSNGSLSTDGYMLLAETKPIKPGKVNTEDLVVKKSPLYTIPFTDSKGVNYPNGKEIPFDFQKAGGYTPKKTVFVPFLGDNIGHLSPNEQLVRGVNGIGTNVDLLNSLTPYKQPIYYYVKREPAKVTPEFEKELAGRALTDGEFRFKLTEEKSTPDKHEETVTNKNGKATFSELSFSNPGNYKYKITELKGSDTNVDYDAMTVTMTVTVTEKNAVGDLEATVKYDSEGGFSADANDKIFNNYVVSPVVTKFDFTKKLAGRKLKEGEFSFVLKNAAGEEVETVKNKEDGTVTFSELSFDNTKVGRHTYTVEEVIPATKELGMTYDTMKATLTVEVTKNGHALTTVTNVSSAGGVNENGESTDGTEDKEFNNKITPPETPEFRPEKFVLNKEKFDITGTKLVDDDDELTNEYTDTNADPYADITTNNEAENINTKTVERGSKLVYQVWLDTTKFTDKNNVQYVGVSDKYDADKLTVESSSIKAYDGKTGVDVTDKFDITVENGTISATSKKKFVNADNVINTTEFEFGRYYKFDIPATVKENVAAGADIENTANQIVHVYNPVSKTVEKPEKPTQKRVNSVPIEVEFNFTKKLEGRELHASEFSFVLKDSKGKEVETVKNDADGKVKFKALKFEKSQVGEHKYTVEEVAGADATITYDTMKAEVKVTVSHDGTAKALIANVTEPADKEFNNTVTPPTEPKFQPEKYVLNTEKYSITDNKLLDDDKELEDKYKDTNINPYVDQITNNEAENINTQTVKRGDKLVYQVWLDTTKFTTDNKEKVQSVGITDDFDETKVDVDGTKIKAYDSVSGDDVTNKFDITVENGVMTATLKAGNTKSLGDAENTQIIDTAKFEFGRYYKFDIPAVVKNDVDGGVDIENTATQVVNYYNPVSKKVEKPSKPTEKRVNSVPISVEFNFTKKLEGRELQANEFSFVLKDSKGNEVETVKNDATGNVKFSALEYKKGEEGVYNYTVEEVVGTDATVTYDTMKAEVTVTVSHDGTAKALIATVTNPADKEFNNTVTPPEEPKFQPEKYVVATEKYDITGDKLLDDDKELTNKYTETNTDPYVDKDNNNEAENLNTKTVKRGSKLVYQVWLDTTQFDANNRDNIQTVGISDNYDEGKLTLNEADIKAYDSVTGAEVTDKFDIAVNNGVITATLKAGNTKSLGYAENTQIIDTTKFEFGRYYKFDIPTTVKEDVAAGADIENTAAQVVNYYNPTTKKVEKPEKPTQKRVNNVPVPLDLKFTKKLEGRDLAEGEFRFVLKKDGDIVETVKNDATGKITFKTLEFGKDDLGKTYNYTVEELTGVDTTVTYDPMVATVKVVVSHDGTAKAIVANVTDAEDKEFNNRVAPPSTPEFNPEKYILNEEKFDITGNKLLDDDKELADKVADTNANPYVDQADNNEAQNINTKTLKKGDKVVYQVWLDTTKFTEAHHIQSVGVTDKYDSENLDVNVADIKAYDSVTGEDVTAKFDIAIVNGVITATSKADLTKSLGDEESTQVIDTAKLAFGRYYKFDIPARIKEAAKEGVDIENTASQIVHQYDPTKKTVEKPEKPTEKRVVNIPVKVEFSFTKKLEGRELKAGEFTFVLKDKDGKVIETVSNDAEGKIKFSALEFKRGEEGTHLYHVEEVKGTETGMEYDGMVATVNVTVTKDGKVLTLTTQMPEDTEFNNKVTPPTPPVTPPTPPVTPPTPPVTPPTPPVTPPTPPVTPPTPPVTPPTPPMTPPTPPMTPPTPPVTPPTPPVTPPTPPVTPPTPPMTPPTPPVTPPTPETPKEGELPNTSEESTTVVSAIGAVLGLFGLGLVTKRKEDEV